MRGDQSSNKNHLRLLIQQSLEGSLSPEESRILQETILKSAEARQYYIDYIMVHSSLFMISNEIAGEPKKTDLNSVNKLLSALSEQEKTAPSIEIPKQEPPKELIQKVVYQKSPIKINKVSVFTLLLSAAAMIVLFAYVCLVPVRNSSCLGYLNRTAKAKWINSNASLAEGGMLYAGPINLSEGVAEIALESGAKVILEAPVRVVLEDSSRVFLEQGRLVADISNSTEQRFVVRTPYSTVVDFGTEFGVEVDEKGYSLAHVFQGKVDVRSGSDPLKFESSVNLKAGESASVNQQNVISKTTCPPQKFVRQEQMDTYVLAAKGSNFHQWLMYNINLHRDKDLVGDYIFKRDADNPDMLKNSAPNFTSLQGIPGRDSSRPYWVEGRWPQKTALKFVRDEDRKIIIPASKELAIGGPITLAAWVRVDDIRTGGHILSCRNGSQVNYQLAWFGSDHQFEGHRNRIQFLRYSNAPAQNPLSSEIVLQPNRWHLIAVTHDNREICFYMDGKLISRSSYVYEHEPVAADLVIGDVDYPITGYEKNRFDGILDEVVILRRVMSEHEIYQMYQDGMPE